MFTSFNLPFSDQIDYSRFVITFDVPDYKLKSTNFNELFRPHLNDTKWITDARTYIKQIRQFLQFSWPYSQDYKLIDPSFKYDAYGMFLADLAKYLKK